MVSTDGELLEAYSVGVEDGLLRMVAALPAGVVVAPPEAVANVAEAVAVPAADTEPKREAVALPQQQPTQQQQPYPKQPKAASTPSLGHAVHPNTQIGDTVGALNKARADAVLAINTAVHVAAEEIKRLRSVLVTQSTELAAEQAQAQLAREEHQQLRQRAATADRQVQEL